jgi:hypothetical protein
LEEKNSGAAEAAAIGRGFERRRRQRLGEALRLCVGQGRVLGLGGSVEVENENGSIKCFVPVFLFLFY